MVRSIRSTRVFIAAVAALFVFYACGGDSGGGTTDPELGGIRGSVEDQTGSGVANASITATKGSSVRTATSASNGDFSFSSLESGSWSVVLAVPTGFSLAAGEVATRTVTVAAGQNAQVQTFMLQSSGGGGPTTGTISGRVTAASAGVANAVIALTGVAATQSTNANGDYTFTEVAPGARTVTITPPTGFALAAGQAAAKNTTVTAGQTATVNWTLQQQSSGGVTAVSMSNLAFVPPTVTVVAGSTVRWTNQDAVAHNVTGSSFNSSNLQQNGQFSFTFNTAGSFPYQCTLHNGMTGTVTVTAQ